MSLWRSNVMGRRQQYGLSQETDQHRYLDPVLHERVNYLRGEGGRLTIAVITPSFA
jgi:hypothetical protein